MMITSSAPAKINLSLRILRKREDGFHELVTRMAPLELADEISISTDLAAGEISFTCSDPTVPSDERNLVIKAVRLLEKHHGPLPGLKIHLEKRIPHGAGLGGGSSDAAITLQMVNQLAELRLPDSVLANYAAELGSDVPFFLTYSICDCAGRGELVTPISTPPLRWRILLIKLPFGVPTPWAYSQWKDSTEIAGIDYREQSLDGTILVNDLERPVFQKHFILAHLKSWLLGQSSVLAALMSGSGSTVFAVLREDAELDSLREGIKEQVGNEVWIHETRLAV
jgi:4-diphosphocytidyl-2-C-methyl-D-erythritol kinase